MSFRVEEKLLVSSNQLAGLLEWLSDEGATLLHPKRRIYSTYFDTPGLDIFAASEEGSVPRKKVRVRSYNTSGHLDADSALEIKVSSVEGRFKTVRKLTRDDVRQLFSAGYFDADYGYCEPVVSVAYRREYFRVKDVRLTIDTDIEYSAAGSRFAIRDGGTAVELKADYGVSMNMLAQAFPFQRIRFSKYARSINAVRKGSAEWV